MSVRHLEPIREAVRKAGADALWVHPAVDFRYLTGLAPIAVERPTALVVLAGELRVLAPRMLAPELALPLLGDPPERREVEVATAFGGPGARDGFELVLRAVTEGRWRASAEYRGTRLAAPSDTGLARLLVASPP